MGGFMSRDEEAAIVAAWHAFIAGRTVDRRTYLDFLDTRVRPQARFRGLSVFEVLDVLVNAPEPEARRESA